MTKRKIKGKICRNNNLNLYHLSEENHHNKVFKPRIPKSVAIDYNENNTIARICFSTSMSGAFRAIDFDNHSWWSIPFYVHKPIDISKAIKNKNVIKPSTDLVYDADYTNEYWIREKIKLKCIGRACFRYIQGSIFDKRFRTRIEIKWLEKYE